MPISIGTFCDMASLGIRDLLITDPSVRRRVILLWVEDPGTNKQTKTLSNITYIHKREVPIMQTPSYVITPHNS